MEPLSFERIKRYSLKERKSKVIRSDFGKPIAAGEPFSHFLKSLPNILAAKDLRSIVQAMANAYRKKLPIVWSMGAHVIKVGLTPVVIDLMKNGLVSGIALNGAGIIHDLELAMIGQTSEDVATALDSRKFGMAEETALFINDATKQAYKEKRGLGETMGKKMLESHLPYAEESILAEAYRLNIPITVHVAIGGDIVHMHPQVSGEALGDASFRDFQIFCRLISQVTRGSVLLNIGSAVVLPVVIEKAIAVCRNLEYPVEGFVGVNFDFIAHYRSQLNPVSRARDLGGMGYQIIGHHEILFPLLAAAVKEELKGR